MTAERKSENLTKQISQPEEIRQRLADRRFFSVDDDGLAQRWSGRVFLNPPYSHPHLSQFVRKLCEAINTKEVAQAILLTNSSTDTLWWQRAADSAASICFHRGRISFWTPAGMQGSALKGQTIGIVNFEQQWPPPAAHDTADDYRPALGYQAASAGHGREENRSLCGTTTIDCAHVGAEIRTRAALKVRRLRHRNSRRVRWRTASTNQRHSTRNRPARKQLGRARQCPHGRRLVRGDDRYSKSTSSR